MPQTTRTAMTTEEERRFEEILSRPNDNSEHRDLESEALYDLAEDLIVHLERDLNKGGGDVSCGMLALILANEGIPAILRHHLNGLLLERRYDIPLCRMNVGLEEAMIKQLSQAPNKVAFQYAMLAFLRQTDDTFPLATVAGLIGEGKIPEKFAGEALRLAEGHE
jgi:hypothetical protein